MLVLVIGKQIHHQKKLVLLTKFIFEVLQAELNILDPPAVHLLCDIPSYLSPVNLTSTLKVLHVASNAVKVSLQTEKLLYIELIMCKQFHV